MAPRAAPPPPRSSGNLYFRGARQLPHQSAPLLTRAAARRPPPHGGERDVLLVAATRPSRHVASRPRRGARAAPAAPPPAKGLRSSREAAVPAIGARRPAQASAPARTRCARQRQRPQSRGDKTRVCSKWRLQHRADRPSRSASSVGRSQSAGTIGQQQQRAMRPSSAGPRGRYGSFGMPAAAANRALRRGVRRRTTDGRGRVRLLAARRDARKRRAGRALALAQTAADGQSMTRGEQQELPATRAGAAWWRVQRRDLFATARRECARRTRRRKSRAQTASIALMSARRQGPARRQRSSTSRIRRDRQADKKWQAPGRRGVASKSMR